MCLDYREGAQRICFDNLNIVNFQVTLLRHSSIEL